MGTRLVLTTVLASMLTASCAAHTSSCATRDFWRATDPDGFVSIPQNEVTEAELQKRGVPYSKEQDGTYRVGKTMSERLGDHALRFVFTPVTVCVDTAPSLTLLALDCLAMAYGGQPADASIVPPCISDHR